MNTYFFTFGQSHVHPETLEPLKDNWIEVQGESYNEARQKMFAKYGDKWAFQYDIDNFEPNYFPKGCYETIT